MEAIDKRLASLAGELDGELKFDNITRIIYSTDASVYREKPLAVAWPAGAGDIKKLIKFALEEGTYLTMRAAGTSLAGQVVSGGIIVDVSRHMNSIIEINKEEKWVDVEPGVVLDELNLKLRDYGLFFGPETSTSNRCNIGGMVGNNACGSHSLIYGSTRDHLLEVNAILSDGSEVKFRDTGRDEFIDKCSLQNLEGNVYRQIYEMLGDEKNLEEIRKGFPDPSVKRRNTGYAIDLLTDCNIFDETSDKLFNFSRLLAGSEGTLAVTTSVRLNLVPLPPKNKAVVCVHLEERNQAFDVNLIALKFAPTAVELMDNRILELTEGNLSQKNNRFFLVGNPGAIVIVEFAEESNDIIDSKASGMTEAMQQAGLGYAFPVIKGKDISKVWNLRKAGLGILANMKGDAKPVALIEDTAVNVEQFTGYINDIESMLASHGKEAVFHAHIGTGELHLRPILNLKDPEDTELFRTIGKETAAIVRKFNGSLSGEHGDGRLRGEFIPFMIGEHNYRLLEEVKKCWDRSGILNPGKITKTPPMNSSLRYIPGKVSVEPETYYDFSENDGFLRSAEKCNGSADCRKSALIGGTMCPSFMATGDEMMTTRARANVMREFISMDGDPWNHKEIYDILDNCLGCKGCKSECPSSVDMAKMKSEFLQHWYERHGISLRTRMIAYIDVIFRVGSIVPGLFNSIAGNRVFSGIIKKLTGFARQRSIPLLHTITLRRWVKKNLEKLNPSSPTRTVCLFIDEFTNYNDTAAGIALIRLLTSLNYKVITVRHDVSARTFISKGLVKTASIRIKRNIKALDDVISNELPLIGLEPSAILGFRDEYPELAGAALKETAERIASNSFMADEFIAAEFRAGRIDRKRFTDASASIILHAHCQQKAVASSKPTIEMLSIPVNYSVNEIPTGCCGMAGSFGYEEEHYDLSVKVGELLLFPEVRKAPEGTIVAAPGTSCRHHIKDGTGKRALHPVEVLWNALIKQ